MATPALYRKLPVEIEAVRFTGGAEAASHIIDWIIANDGTARWHEELPPSDIDAGWSGTQPEHIAIDTLEGTMRALAGWWVIRGVKGEFYPCEPGIFAATYEAVT